MDGGPASSRRPPLRVNISDSVLWVLKVLRRRALEDAAATVAHSAASLNGAFPPADNCSADLRLDAVYLHPDAPLPPQSLLFANSSAASGATGQSLLSRQSQFTNPESGQPIGLGAYLLRHTTPAHGTAIDSAIQGDHPLYAWGGKAGSCSTRMPEEKSNPQASIAAAGSQAPDGTTAASVPQSKSPFSSRVQPQDAAGSSQDYAGRGESSDNAHSESRASRSVQFSSSSLRSGSKSSRRSAKSRTSIASYDEASLKLDMQLFEAA